MEEVVEQTTKAEEQCGTSEATGQAETAAAATEGAVEQSAESDVEKAADDTSDSEVEDLNEDGEAVRKQAVKPVECESCHETYIPEEFKVIDIAGHPEVKDALVTGEYFLTECPHCGAKGIRPYPVTVIDSEKKFWILLVFNGDMVSAIHRARISLVSEEFRKNGEEWKERVVLGPHQLDEKFRIFNVGLDDTAVEFAKVMLARRARKASILSLLFHGIDHDSVNFSVPGKRTEDALFEIPLDVFKAAYQEGLDSLNQFPSGMMRYVTGESVFAYVKILEETTPSAKFHDAAEQTGLLETTERGDIYKWHKCSHELAMTILDRIGVPEIKTLANVRDFFVGSFSISFGIGLGASMEWRNNPTGFAASPIFEMMIVPDGLPKVLENAYARLGAFATAEIKDAVGRCITASLHESVNGMGRRGYLVRTKHGGICVDPRLTEQVQIYLLMAVEAAVYQGLVSGLSIQTGGVQENVQNGIKVRVSCSQFLNLAEAQNRIPLLRSIKIKNQTIGKLDNLVCTISSEEQFVAEKKIKLRPLEMGASAVLSSSELLLEPNLELLKGLQDAAKGSITVTVSNGQDILYQNRYIIDALPANQAHDIFENPLLLAAFVKPNSTSVRAFQSYVGEAMADISEDHSTALPIYQQNDPDSMKKFSRDTCAAIYAALQKGTKEAPGTVYGYANPLSNSDGKCQQIRLPDEIFDKHQATCLDSSLLFASIMESVGLHAALMIINGHAFVGCHLLERTLPSPEYDDKQGIRRRISNGEFVVIETTALAEGRCFADAVESAEEKLADNFRAKFICAVDVAMARLNKIHPIYFDKEEDAAFEAIAQKNLYKGIGKLKELQRTIDVKSLQPRKRLEGRVEVWAQKLLNLSPSNPMLNAKEYKGTTGAPSREIIYFPDGINIGDLEDWLAAGDDVSIRSVAEVLSKVDFEQGFTRVREREQEVIEAEAASHRIALPVDGLLWRRCAEYNATHARPVDPAAEQAKRVKKRLRDLYALGKKDVEEIGAQTLYAAIGFLKWSEVGDDGIVGTESYMAPILLVPISIERRLSDVGLCVVKRDEDTVINTTLLELLKVKFGIDIPDLGGKDSNGTLPEDQSGVDVPYIIGVFKQFVGKGLEVVERAAVGRFSFGRYAMWRDLHDHLDVLEKSKPVSQLISGDARTLDDGVEAFEKREIDRHLDPEDLFCPVSADSSQLSAVLYSAMGKSFILQGPPGTGKSQTITNMVAHNLAKGRRVLFVAEKPGALDEVYRRLTKVGLTPFCLALHSTKCDKKQVMRQLNDSVQLLDKLSAKPTSIPEAWQEEIDKINSLRGGLSTYVKQLHRAYPNELTAYDCFARSIKNGNSPYVDRVTADCLVQTKKELEDQIKTLDRLVSMMRLLSDPKILTAFPALRPADWTPSYQEGLRKAAEAVAALSGPQSALLGRIWSSLGLEEMPDVASVGKLLPYLEVVREVKNRPANLSESIGKYSPEQLRQAVEDVLHHDERRVAVRAECDKAEAALFGYDIGRLINVDARDVRQRIQEAKQATLIMRGFRQKAIIKEFAPVKKDGKLTIEELLDALKKVDEYRAVRKRLDDLVEAGGMAVAPVDAETLGDIARLQGEWTAFTTRLDELGRYLSDHESIADVADAGECAKKIIDNLAGDKLRRYCKYRPVRVEAEERGLGPFAELLENGLVKGGDMVRAYQDAYHAKMLLQIDNAEPELSGFFGEEHEEKIQAFKEAVNHYNELTKKVIFHRLAKKYPDKASLDHADSQALRIIRQEIGKSRMPLRRFLMLTRYLVNKFKPCFLMSPDSVAQFLPMESDLFDMVIFDEASQIKVCDAIGVMARARQVVVVGDEKQMPPSSSGATGNAALLDSQMDIKDAESILSDCSQSGFMDVYLNWHYRSRHESLIAFSNAHYYAGQLYSFPSVSNSDSLGVEYRYVPGAYYEGDSQNSREADAIVDYVHKLMTSPTYLAHPKSIGIVTFAKKQGDDINAKLNRRCESDPVLSAVLSRWLDNPVGEGAKGKRGRKKKDDAAESAPGQANASEDLESKAANVTVGDGEELFFIKNLEGVQGKEADIILYSICFAQNEDGKWPSNYGPIGHVGGGRRLNVAVTRAKEKMIVFSSIPNPAAMPIGKNSSPELQDFKAFLVYAKDPTGAGACEIKPQDDPGFVSAVARFLTENGFTVRKNVGLSGYKIDIGVVNPYSHKEYILGVECDGPSYSRQLTVRDRDVLRSVVLGAGGWNMCRVWSSEWQHTPEQARQRLLNKAKTIVARYEVRKCFTLLNAKKRLVDEDMEYLVSEASAFDFGLNMPSVLMMKPTAEEELEQPNPNLKYYYKDIQFKWKGRTYLLTNQFTYEQHDKLMEWLGEHQIDSDAFAKICRGEGFKFQDEIAAEEEARKKAEEEAKKRAGKAACSVANTVSPQEPTAPATVKDDAPGLGETIEDDPDEESEEETAGESTAPSVEMTQPPLSQPPSHTNEDDVPSVTTGEGGDIHLKIGKVAQTVFPVLFMEGRENADDIAFLMSNAAIKQFKTSGNQVLKQVLSDVEVESRDANGIKRFYTKFVLPHNGKNYMLTNQWFKNGLPNLLAWIEQHGISLDRVKELCGAIHHSVTPVNVYTTPVPLPTSITSRPASPPETPSASPMEPPHEVPPVPPTPPPVIPVTPPTPPVVTPPSDGEFPFKVGEVAKKVIPVLFAEGRASAEDVAFLLSDQAIKFFKTAGNKVFKVVTTTPEEDARDEKGRNRFYKKFTIKFGGVDYLLTSQWYNNGSRPLLDWLAQHGISEERVKEICGGGVVQPPASPVNVQPPPVAPPQTPPEPVTPPPEPPAPPVTPPTPPVTPPPAPAKAEVKSLPLTESALMNVRAPLALMIDGEDVRIVSSWKDCYQALCERLMALDPAKFDALPDLPQFRRFFVRAVPHKKYSDCYVAKFGSENNVRIKEIGSKSYFYMPNYVVYNLLKHFGIDPTRVTIRI